MIIVGTGFCCDACTSNIGGTGDVHLHKPLVQCSGVIPVMGIELGQALA